LQKTPQRQIERRVYSQFGEDGIIEFLLQSILPERATHTFVDIGAGNGYKISNTWALALDGYGGLAVERRATRADALRRNYEKNNVLAVPWCAKVTPEWVKRNSEAFPERPDLLSLDIDSIDYYILKEILAVGIRPTVLCLEYNPNFGPEMKATARLGARISSRDRNLHYGASLALLDSLATKNGYEFVCCESHGSNAFFVRSASCDAKRIDCIEWLGWQDSEWHKGQWGSMEERWRLIRTKPIKIYK
jgi:hypothetical protein